MRDVLEVPLFLIFLKLIALKHTKKVTRQRQKDEHDDRRDFEIETKYRALGCVISHVPKDHPQYNAVKAIIGIITFLRFSTCF